MSEELKLEMNVQVLMETYEEQVNAATREAVYAKALLKQEQMKVIELQKELADLKEQMKPAKR